MRQNICPSAASSPIKPALALHFHSEHISHFYSTLLPEAQDLAAYRAAVETIRGERIPQALSTSLSTSGLPPLPLRWPGRRIIIGCSGHSETVRHRRFSGRELPLGAFDAIGLRMSVTHPRPSSRSTPVSLPLFAAEQLMDFNCWI